MAELDTIQILNHVEYFSRETRHEIVRLRHGGECAKLDSTTPNLMCGREPFLSRCSAESSSLQRINRCANSKTPLSAAMLRALHNATFNGRCAMTSNFTRHTPAKAERGGSAAIRIS